MDTSTQDCTEEWNLIDIKDISCSHELHVVLFDSLWNQKQSFSLNWILGFECLLAFQTIHTVCDGDITRSKQTIPNNLFCSHCRQCCITGMTSDMLETTHYISCSGITFSELFPVAWDGRYGVPNMNHILSCVNRSHEAILCVNDFVAKHIVGTSSAKGCTTVQEVQTLPIWNKLLVNLGWSLHSKKNCLCYQICQVD